VSAGEMVSWEGSMDGVEGMTSSGDNGFSIVCYILNRTLSIVVVSTVEVVVKVPESWIST
jgi:hypothetical protein